MSVDFSVTTLVSMGVVKVTAVTKVVWNLFTKSVDSAYNKTGVLVVVVSVARVVVVVSVVMMVLVIVVMVEVKVVLVVVCKVVV